MKEFTTPAVFIFLLLAAACSSKPPVVNSGPSSMVLPGGQNGGNLGYQQQLTEDAMRQSSDAAITGTVMTSDAIPIPLSRVQVGLYQFEKQQWKELSRFNTETNGSFRVTRKLTSGSYELRILDKRYKGTAAVTLTTEPAKNVILQAQPAH